MTSVVTEKPVCQCHGEPMYWHKHASRKAGGYWICSVKERDRSRRYREANPEKRLESIRRWREKNPDKVLEYRRLYYEANRDQALEYGRLYYEANRDRALERTRANRARRLDWRTAGVKNVVYLPTAQDKERLAALIRTRRAEQQAEYANLLREA